MLSNRDTDNLKELRVIAEQDNIDRLNVAAIIINEDKKVLLCQRSLFKKVAPGAWHMPGGKVEDSETIEKAIERELAEELGLSIDKFHGYSGVEHNYQIGKENHRTFFVVVTAKGDIQLNPENADYKFVAHSEISNYLEPELVEINERAASAAMRIHAYSQLD